MLTWTCLYVLAILSILNWVAPTSHSDQDLPTKPSFSLSTNFVKRVVCIDFDICSDFNDLTSPELRNSFAQSICNSQILPTMGSVECSCDADCLQFSKHAVGHGSLRTSVEDLFDANKCANPRTLTARVQVTSSIPSSEAISSPDEILRNVDSTKLSILASLLSSDAVSQPLMHNASARSSRIEKLSSISSTPTRQPTLSSQYEGPNSSFLNKGTVQNLIIAGSVVGACAVCFVCVLTQIRMTAKKSAPRIPGRM